MPNTCCCVPGCKERGGHRFPLDADKCKAWVIAIKRDSQVSKGKLWWPSDNSVVCKAHFVDEDFQELSKTGELYSPVKVF